MLQQMKESLRKFVGRNIMVEDEKEQVVEIKSTHVTKEELNLNDAESSEKEIPN